MDPSRESPARAGVITAINFLEENAMFFLVRGSHDCAFVHGDVEGVKLAEAANLIARSTDRLKAGASAFHTLM
jgi:hypothetical protein